MTQGELDHREADPDSRRARRHDAGERNGIAVDAFTREVVLGEPDAIEARRLGKARLLHEILDRSVIAVGRPGMCQRQPAELHWARGRADGRTRSPRW